MLDRDRGWSKGRDLVMHYDLAKEAWERWGDQGPPVGETVMYLHWHRHFQMLGVDRRDPRTFLIGTPGCDPYDRKAGEYVFIISREQWWAFILPADTCLSTDKDPGARWERLTA